MGAKAPIGLETIEAIETIATIEAVETIERIETTETVELKPADRRAKARQPTTTET